LYPFLQRKEAGGRRRLQNTKDFGDPQKNQNPLSVAILFLSCREKRLDGNGGCRMAKTVVLLRRILTLVIPVLYIVFVTGFCLSILDSYNLYLPVFLKISSYILHNFVSLFLLFLHVTTI
jgi:hypothetical protein